MEDGQTQGQRDDQNAAWFRAVREEIAGLSAFDGADLLSKVAALHLDPANAKHLIRLEAISHFVTAEHAGESARIGRDRLRRLVNGGVIAKGIMHLEDPPETVLTSCVSFFGGSYLYLTGLCAGIEFSFGQLARAIGLHRQGFSDETFRPWAVQLIRASLTLSDQVLARADLGRYVVPEFGSREVLVPNSARLLNLQNAVWFTESEVSRLLDGVGGRAVLAPLTTTFGGPSVHSFQPDREAFDGRPLVQCRDGLVVASPSGLISSTAVAIIAEAARRGLSQELAERFAGAVWDKTCESLRICTQGDQIPLASFWSGPPVPCREGVFSIDLDKAMYVMSLTDSMEMDADDRVRVPMALEGHEEAIDRRLAHSIEELLSRFPRLNEISVLVLLQTCATSALLGTDGPVWLDEALPGMSADELSVLAHLSKGNSLMLRQFGKARQRFEARVELMAWSRLDEFAFYRKRRCSFFGEERMNALTLASDYQFELRSEVARTRDWHGVTSPSGGTVEVVRRWEQGDIPIYFAPSMMHARVSLVLESRARQVWVMGPTDGSVDHALLDMLSYWLWQFESDLWDLYDASANARGVVVLEIEAPAFESWKEPPTRTLPLEECVTVGRGNHPGWYNVHLKPETSSHLRAFDNSGERELMAVVLRALRGHCDPEERRTTDEGITQCIERHAPLGPKKMFHMLPADPFAGLHAPPFGSVRLAQAAEESQVEDDLADFLRAEKYAEGAVGHEERRREETLNQCVAYLYREFVRLMATVSPDGLLEILLGANDALVADGRWRELTLPQRLACFSDAPTLAREYAEEAGDNARTGVALRWIIEYVAARPPRGLRPVSMSALDRAMAIVTTMNRLGSESDYLFFNVVDSDVVIQPSGRLSVESQLGDTRHAFVSRRALGTIRRNQAAWIQWAQASKEPDQDERRDQEAGLEAVSLKEFGVPLSRLSAVVECLLAEVEPRHGSIVRESREDVVSRVSDALSCGDEEASKCIDCLTLTERDDFLRPPPPFSDEKPYPWKLGRELLLVRRPIIQRTHGKTVELLWGMTQLSRAPEFIRALVLSGRLKARTPEMREFIGRVHKEQGKEFESRVMKVVEQDGELVVRGRLRKIGKDKLVDRKGRDLGDIDVLVAWPKRKLLLALECKDLSVGRTPSEVSNELGALFRDTESRDSAKTKHVRRAAWLAAHVAETLAWLGLRPGGKWRVVPVVVTSVELMGAEFESGLPVVTVTELEHEGLTELATKQKWHQHRVKAESGEGES